MDLEVGALGKLGRQDVLDTDGRRIRMADLWRDRRAVMAFVRHFG